MAETPSRTWHKGPPPHVGWWNANTLRSHCIWRWWDGENWSEPAGDTYDKYAAGRMARYTNPSNIIEWTDYWPNARVPRVNPNEVEA